MDIVIIFVFNVKLYLGVHFVVELVWFVGLLTDIQVYNPYLFKVFTGWLFDDKLDRERPFFIFGEGFFGFILGLPKSCFPTDMMGYY